VTAKSGGVGIRLIARHRLGGEKRKSRWLSGAPSSRARLVIKKKRRKKKAKNKAYRQIVSAWRSAYRAVGGGGMCCRHAVSVVASGVSGGGVS